ncbi:HD domain-containing protein [Candidatus Enterococcus ferrettii]|uniref:HD/PDEase domain-containing protein n=1 Tax=Candidatus Enterococcus ferrettii TaxID=2815324 RepID=A0ABV0ESH3_9ENTE|nr:HD domain-containing protein [Enterococcus sp. 665A]MBO1340738.1 HD domain-containing protein [Enterococcus sp. 665A]
MSEQLSAIRNYSYEKLNADTSGHDFFHSERVAKIALALQEKENAGDAAVIWAASYLHDVIDDKVVTDPHQERQNISDFLASLEWSSDQIAHVLSIIDNLSYSRELEMGKAELTLEGQLVQDADRIDALGAIGIMRTAYYGGHTESPLYLPDVAPKNFKTKAEYRKKSTVINHFYEKLLLLEKTMNTAAGKAEARLRTKFMQTFLTEFYAEWDGKLLTSDENEEKMIK